MKAYFFKTARYYTDLLSRYKYPVQIISGGVLWFTGDLLSQTLTFHFNTPHDDSSKNNKESKGENELIKHQEKGSKIDWNRIGKMTFYGMCFSAPIYAFWYSFLHNLSEKFLFYTPRLTESIRMKSKLLLAGKLKSRLDLSHSSNSTATAITNNNNRIGVDLDPRRSHASHRMWRMIWFKIVSDIFIFDPLYLSFFFIVTSTLENKTRQEIKEKISSEFGFTFLVDILVWCPIQILNFRYVPVIYQALIVQSCNIGWNAFLSFVQHK